MRKKVIIIGGGAAGIAAAIFAAKAGAEVTILEHTPQIGKKLLSTGNGRCNLTNSYIKEGCFRSSQPDFPEQAVSAFGWKDTLSWFASMGVLCHSRMETYYYPMSDQASAVLDCMKLELKRLQVRVVTEVEVREIFPAASRCGRDTFRKDSDFCSFLVKTVSKSSDSASGKTVSKSSNNASGKAISNRLSSASGSPSVQAYEANAVILACGSKAAPSTGSDGSGYDLAGRLGHRIMKPLPALVQLRCQGGHYRQLAGIRTDAGLRLYCNGIQKWEEQGELQLTDYGISGIPVFQLSRYAAMALEAREKVTVVIDFLPSFSREETKQLLDTRFEQFGDRKGEDFLTGLLNKKLAAVLLKLSGIPAELPVKKASAKQREALFLALKQYEALVSSVNPFANAQVCCGGVDVAEVNPVTMESRLVPGLYFAGELLDVDGICGGYNLQWAWSSGYAAGSHAAGGHAAEGRVSGSQKTESRDSKKQSSGKNIPKTDSSGRKHRKQDDKK